MRPTAAPRFTGISDVPSNALCVQPSTVTYPYAPPGDANCGFAITWGADNKLKTPYAEAMDFSVQREILAASLLSLPTWDGWAGICCRPLIWQSRSTMSTRRAVVIISLTPPSFPSWLMPMGATGTPRYRLFPTLKTSFPNSRTSTTQAKAQRRQFIPTNGRRRAMEAGETTALADLDFYCSYGCPQGTKFWQSQFSSLYAWSSIGMSYYNAGQITLRHPMSHGLQADFSYTLSKSIDMGSDAERASEISANGSFSDIINTWNPSLNRAVSDFDTKHLITFDWVYQLPFGHGQKFANSTNRFVDELIGGWQWTGVPAPRAARAAPDHAPRPAAAAAA